jgi:hypothetical protein
MDLSFDEDPRLVECHRLSEDPLVRNLDSFILNRPAGIQGVDNSFSILATTTVMSWQDSNNDMKWDGAERGGPFPVFIRTLYGDGEVILLSDPSIFINQMIRQEGNKQLYQNLISYLTGEGVTRIYIDEEHHATTDPLQVFTVIIRAAPDYQRIILVWIVLTIIIWVIHPRLRKGAYKIIDLVIGMMFRIISLGARDPTTTSDPVDECKQRHPEWNTKILDHLGKTQ